jgi:ketosteroid isomerase-like protein
MAAQRHAIHPVLEREESRRAPLISFPLTSPGYIVYGGGLFCYRWLPVKTRVLSLVLALLLPLAVHCATAPAAEELTQMLRTFLDGASRNDIAAHARFWADDLIYTRSAGVRMGKAEILANARSSASPSTEPPTQYSAEDIRIQQYGDTAVVAFRLVGKTGTGAQAQVMQFLNTGTFVKRNGEWRVVAWQSTRVPEPEKESAK